MLNDESKDHLSNKWFLKTNDLSTNYKVASIVSYTYDTKIY